MGDSTLEWINDKIKGFDIFGKTVIPTYNTKVGGIMSIIILAITSYASVIYVKGVLNYSEIKFNKNEKKLTLLNEKDAYNFTSDKGVKFAFYWESPYGYTIDETVATITITQYSIRE